MNTVCLVLALALGLSLSCSATKEAFSPARVQRSKELYGQQQQSGENTRRTPAEEAGERHNTDARPKNPDAEEE
jgi:hypothetical protein